MADIEHEAGKRGDNRTQEQAGDVLLCIYILGKQQQRQGKNNNNDEKKAKRETGTRFPGISRIDGSGREEETPRGTTVTGTAFLSGALKAFLTCGRQREDQIKNEENDSRDGRN